MAERVSRRDVMALGTAALMAAGRGPGASAARRVAQPEHAESLERLRAQAGVPGLSLAVIRDGDVAWTYASGVTNRATGAPVTADTVFQAASLTKPLFAHVVLGLCARGSLSLDAPIRDLVPAGELSSQSWAAQVTPRTILSHSSGLPAFRPARGRMTPRSVPGTRFAYSGAGYDLLQQAVERVTGQPLHVYAGHALLGPLGLSRSSLVWLPEHETTCAAGYEWDGGLVREPSRPDTASAAGSLHTTAADYARFLVATMSATESAGLDYATKRLGRAPQVRLDERLAWGLGWGLHLDDAGDAFWHFGDSRGFMSFAMGFPARQSGIAIFTNGRPGLRLSQKVADELEDEPRHRAAISTVFRWIYEVFYEGRLRG